MSETSDIEIYIRDCPVELIQHWLEGILGQPTSIFVEEFSTIYHFTFEGNFIPVILTTGIEDGPFTSVWLNSPHRPWRNAASCARQASKVLQREIRCQPETEAAPDIFLSITGKHERLVGWEKE